METNIKTDLKNLAAENPVFAIKEIVRRHSMQRGPLFPFCRIFKTPLVMYPKR